MTKISDNVTKGVEKAPMRSLFYAMGYTKEELERPLIGVVSAHSEIVPGHIHLDKITEAVKAGVRMAGGTPIMVPAIGVCDGIAMGHEGMKYSLPSRELIADSVETMAKAHQSMDCPGSELRQNRAGNGNGRVPHQHSIHRLFRRTNDERPGERRRNLSLQDVRGGRFPQSRSD